METKEKEESTPKTYELSYLLDPGAQKEESQRLRNYLEEEKALVIEEEPPNLVKLSYPVKKRGQAYFGWFKFLTSPEGLEKIEDKFKKEPALLRKLVVKSERKESRIMGERRKKQAAPKEKIQIEEIDKKLEELLSKI